LNNLLIFLKSINIYCINIILFQFLLFISQETRWLKNAGQNANNNDRYMGNGIIHESNGSSAQQQHILPSRSTVYRIAETI